MKVLVDFFVDCGRMGDLQGLFIAEEQKIKSIIGKTIYFGEVLGKHSEINVVMEDEMFGMKSTNQELIEQLLDVFEDNHTLAGFNPFDYVENND